MTIISLVNVDPRNYLSVIDRVLCANGYAAEAAALKIKPPCDLTAAMIRLPDDVCIRLWEVKDEAQIHA